MNRIASTTLIALTLTLSSCGSSNSAAAPLIDGRWSAVLSKPDGSSAFAFTVMLAQAPQGIVNVTTLAFNGGQMCFGGTTTTQTSTFVQSHPRGMLAGPFQLGISATFTEVDRPVKNALGLQGTANDTKITGTWNLSGSATCTNAPGMSGSFTMTRMAGSMS